MVVEKIDYLRELFPYGTRERVILEMLAQGFSRSQIEKLHWAELQDLELSKEAARACEYYSERIAFRPTDRIFPRRNTVKKLIERIRRKSNSLN